MIRAKKMELQGQNLIAPLSGAGIVKSPARTTAICCQSICGINPSARCDAQIKRM